MGRGKGRKRREARASTVANELEGDRKGGRGE